MQTIGFIGAGNMAEALIKGIIKARLFKPADIFISDVRHERLDELKSQYGITICKTNADLAAKAEVIVLSVKPQNMADVLGELKGKIGEQLVISIAAGIKTEKIGAGIGDIAIVRVMPNTPALVGKGASGIYFNEKAKSSQADVLDIFNAVGTTVVLDDEGLIDAVTALSGSGPAYFFLLEEMMIRAGIEMGLDAQTAKELTLQTAIGAATLAIEGDQKGDDPKALRQKVTSPGGTTEAAIKVLNEGGINALVLQALERACQRSRELSK